MPETLLPTTVVGSYPQPGWLVNREELTSHMVPRVRVPEMWRVPEPFLEQAQDDATIIAIRDMERAGIDVVTDGEMRRESYSNRFATALEGVDSDNPGVVIEQCRPQLPCVPRVVGQDPPHAGQSRCGTWSFFAATPTEGEDYAAGAVHDGAAGEERVLQDVEEMAMDYAVAVNAELRELQKAGADVIQLDEPWLRNDPDAARRYRQSRRSTVRSKASRSPTASICASATPPSSGRRSRPRLLLPVGACRQQGRPDLDRGGAAEARSRRAEGPRDQEDHARRDQSRRSGREQPEQVAERIRAGLKHVSPERLIPAPDCGMKYLPRELAFAKLKALAEGAAIVRKELI